MRNVFLFCCLLLAACAPRASTPPAFDAPVPYHTITPGPTLEQAPEIVVADTPPPTPTPFIYIVKADDTLSQIAERYHVSLDALLAANPDVNPNSMSVDMELKIPGSPANVTGESTPTPAPVSVKQIQCHPTADRAMWCFVLIHNDDSDFMENLSAQITLLDENGQTIVSQAAFLPLNILPPHMSLPLTAFFPPEVPAEAKPQAQVLTSIRLPPDDARYLPATLQNTLVEIDASGLTARVEGGVSLPPESKAATQIWIAAVAYDGSGRVIGVRRWESDAGLPAGGRLPFEFMLSSLAGTIDRVEFAVEARP